MPSVEGDFLERAFPGLKEAEDVIAKNPAATMQAISRAEAIGRSMAAAATMRVQRLQEASSESPLGPDDIVDEWDDEEYVRIHA